jgi:hypothetical protein
MVIQLGRRPVYPVRDDEAYIERLAIVQDSWPTSGDYMEPYRIAGEAAERTRYSVCATADLNDQNWCPLMEWMVEVTIKHGADVAVSIWFEIQSKVNMERAVRGMVERSLRPNN